MATPKRRSRGVQTSDEDDYSHAVEELAEAIVENLSQQTNALEPFEVYAQRMRAKVCSEAYHFRQRFNRGYRILLAELSQRNPSKE